MAKHYEVTSDNGAGKAHYATLEPLDSARGAAHALWYDLLAASGGLDTAAGRRGYERIMAYEGGELTVKRVAGQSGATIWYMAVTISEVEA